MRPLFQFIDWKMMHWLLLIFSNLVWFSIATQDYAIAALICNSELPFYIPFWEEKVYNSINATRTKIIIYTVENLTDDATAKRLKYSELRTVESFISNPSFNPAHDKDKDKHFSLYKSCRYNKLHIFRMTEFRKVVYLDLDAFPVESIEELFQYPGGSAVADQLPYIFNSGVMVIEPSESLYSTLVDSVKTIQSYNGGDQGFLNKVFSKWKTTPELHLPIQYNFLTSFARRSYIFGPNNDSSAFTNNAEHHTTASSPKIIHYTSEVKPWTYYFTGYSFPNAFHENFHKQLYFQWWQEYREFEMRNNRFSFSELGIMEPSRCEGMGTRSAGAGKCSVIMNHFGDNRNALLSEKILPYLLQQPFISKVVIGLQNSSFSCGAFNHQHARVMLHKGGIRNYAYCVNMKSMSFSARFALVQYVNTQCVIVADNDVMAKGNGLAFLYKQWLMSPTQIISPFVRHWDLGNRYHTGSDGINTGYSFGLTKTMLIDISVVENYVCALPEDAYKVVEKYNQCEDFLLNLLSMGMGRGCPRYAYAPFYDFGAPVKRNGSVLVSEEASVGVSVRTTNHNDVRNNCLKDYAKIFSISDKFIESHQCHGIILPHVKETVENVDFSEMMERQEKKKLPKV